jgi:hypothetical protein
MLSTMNTNFMKSSYSILKDTSLIVEVILGRITLKQLETDRDILYCDKEYQPDYDLVLDIRDADVDLSLDELGEYLKYLAGKTDILFGRETVILTRPELKEKFAEFSTILSNIVPMKFRVMDNVKDCLSELRKKNIVSKEMDSLIANLKNNPTHQWFMEPNAIVGF